MEKDPNIKRFKQICNYCHYGGINVISIITNLLFGVWAIILGTGPIKNESGCSMTPIKFETLGVGFLLFLSVIMSTLSTFCAFFEILYTNKETRETGIFSQIINFIRAIIGIFYVILIVALCFQLWVISKCSSNDKFWAFSFFLISSLIYQGVVVVMGVAIFVVMILIFCCLVVSYAKSEK